MRIHGLKVLGLALLAAIGVMAVTAGAAQAVELSKALFLENGSEINSTPKVVKGSATEGELLTVGGIKIRCTGGTAEAEIFNNATEKLGEGKAKILFSGCEVLDNPFCEVYENLANWEAEKDEGTILATGHGFIFFHGTKFYLLVLGLGASKLFTDFGFAGPLCNLPTFDEGVHQEITGSTVIELPDAGTSQKNHTLTTIDPATLSTLFPSDKLALGNEAAHLKGGQTATVALANGANWSAQTP